MNKIIDPAIKARTITNVIPELAFEVNAYLLCLYHAALILLKHLFRFIEPQVSGSLQGTRQYINTLKVIPSALPQMCGGSHNVPSAELSLARLSVGESLIQKPERGASSKWQARAALQLTFLPTVADSFQPCSLTEKPENPQPRRPTTVSRNPMLEPRPCCLG